MIRNISHRVSYENNRSYPTLNRKVKEWWEQQESNLHTISYELIALPLSYAPMLVGVEGIEPTIFRI